MCKNKQKMMIFAQKMQKNAHFCCFFAKMGYRCFYVL